MNREPQNITKKYIRVKRDEFVNKHHELYAQSLMDMALTIGRATPSSEYTFATLYIRVTGIMIIAKNRLNWLRDIIIGYSDDYSEDEKAINAAYSAILRQRELYDMALTAMLQLLKNDALNNRYFDTIRERG